MKKWIKKGVSYHLPEKWMAVLWILLLGIMLVPVLRLALYAVPWYDDYNYALNVKSFINEYGIWPGAFKGAVYVVKTWWWCWQGTFSSIFMMSLMPEVFGEGYYSLGILGIILFFTVSALIFVKITLAKVMKAQKTTQISVAVLVTLTMLELIYTAQQGIYWYNAAVHYTFMHGCLFLLLTAAIKILYAEAWKHNVILAVSAAFLALVCSGSNFVTALQGILLLVLLMLLGAAGKKKSVYYLLPSLCIYGFGLYKNIMAPGNDIRAMYYVGCGPVKSVLLSFQSGFAHFWEFTGVITILILFLYGLMIWNTVSKVQFRFPFPAIVTLLSFCFYCTGFTSSYYGMGTEGLSRTWVVIKFTLQLLLFVNVTYWIGWIQQRCKKRGRQIGQARQWVWAYAFVGLLAVLWFQTNPNQAGSVLSYGAYYYVHTGEAYNLHQEYLQRVETIQSSEESIVEVMPYVWKPWFLYKGELSSDPFSETNKGMADWFGKEGIYIKE